MTKAQTIALNYIENFLNEGGKSFNWGDLMDSVKSSNVKVNNWMVIRAILQQYVNEGLIERSDNLHNEEYENNQI
tara:strand:- start:12 stop:236 length:225 start_codon:yes stop_codon:yes gene_type:complete